MPSRKAVTEKARRRKVEESMRSVADAIVKLRTRIETVESQHALPGCPYSTQLGVIEEYYNCLADEFTDNPDEPPLQTFEAAHSNVRKLHALAITDPTQDVHPTRI